ncbi:hypothetical protein INT47_012771 [Mucor saturninus]|uniref:F-box domain-containing protein n=1 Tax=Mucor saturninus TaxID=64648 RepID=A0A8H7QTG8_9FUNG|nr:hypothetical protein INT47_012771 [Mucor saturninus]
MSRLPYEIQLNVFSRLEAFDQSSCEIVCKSWSYAASETLYRTVDLYGYSDVKRFYHCLISNMSLTKPGFLKKIRINKQRYSSSRNTKDDFLAILTSCGNLKTLIFEDFDPKIYLKWMVDAKIKMPNIKQIGIHRNFRDEALHNNYLQVMLANCESVTQLHINQNTTVNSNTMLQNIDRFPSLNKLTIESHNDIELNPILNNCKMLTQIKLKGCMKRLHVNNSRVGSHPCLQVLKISSLLFSADVCRFVFQNMTELKVLTWISPYSDPQDMHLLMTGLQRQRIHPNNSLQTLVFQHFDGMSTQFLHSLPKYFSDLQNIRFKDCAFNGLWNQKDNVCIDMSPLNLNKITIDIDNIVRCTPQITNIFLQIKLGNGNTLYYVRSKGKLRLNYPFSRTYCTANTVKLKMAAITGAVITVQVKTLKLIEIHAENSTNQTLIIQ